MRLLQARLVGPVTMLAMLAMAAFFAVSPGMAQRGGVTGTGGASAPSPDKGPTTPTPTPAPPTRTPTQTQTPTAVSQPPRPIWITGRVMMFDGGAPPESVTIERVCSGNSVHAEGYTDSTGHFSFNLGQNNGVFADASTSFATFDPSGGTGQSNSSNGSINGSGNASAELAYWDCELRGRLRGYRSATVSLAGRRSLDSPDVGVIVLYSAARIQGLTTSATSGQAPKEARKAYEKGFREAQKEKPKLDQAEQELRKAVELYPRHAAAWWELGKILEKRELYPEAREAYISALAADPKYLYPYQQLYQLALREQNWKDLADRTDQLLHLDPYEFPAAYYFNALAYFQLKEYDTAEKSAHRAVETDWKHSNPKTHYLLGAILIKKQNWIEAAESFRSYLKAAPGATDKAQVEKTLEQIDQQISRVQTASQEAGAQQ